MNTSLPEPVDDRPFVATYRITLEDGSTLDVRQDERRRAMERVYYTAEGWATRTTSGWSRHPAGWLLFEHARSKATLSPIEDAI